MYNVDHENTALLVDNVDEVVNFSYALNTR